MIEQVNSQNISNILINNSQTNNIIDLSLLSNSTMNNEIIIKLIELGYKSVYSKRIFNYYHPKDVQEAIDYLSFENGKIHHYFVQDRNNIEKNICYLCGKEKDIHLDDQIDDSLSEDIKESRIKKSIFENKNNLDIKQSKIMINCPACEEDFLSDDKNTLKNCGHSFCNKCWYDFLSIKIKENKLSSIKCMDYECKEKLDDDFIINLLNSNQELIDKYKKFKLELEIINDPNRKFCPFPNCNSFLELKDKNNKEIKCSNNQFCFLCLKEPHGNSPCKIEIKKSMAEYEKNNFVKKCPKCDIITEKITGCNHITCTKCNYQWCWLCSGEYDPEHFREGKCKGLNLFKPENENEIKPAQEGKIDLKVSQRQDDLISINNNDRHFGVNKFNNSNLFNSSKIINIDRSENNESISNSIENIEINFKNENNENNFENNENNNIEKSLVNSIGNNENNNIEIIKSNCIENIKNNIEKMIVDNIENIKNNLEKSILNDTENIKNYKNNENSEKKNNNKGNINNNNKYENNNCYNIDNKLSSILKIRYIISRFIKKNKKNNFIFKSFNPEINNINSSNNNSNINKSQKNNLKFNNSYSLNNQIDDETTSNYSRNSISNIDNKNNDFNNNDKINDDISYKEKNKIKSNIDGANERFEIKRKENSEPKRNIGTKTNKDKNLNINNTYSITRNGDILTSTEHNLRISIKESINIIKEEEKFSKIKIKNFNLLYSIVIAFIYSMFGHFFIIVNIYLIESSIRKSFLVLASIILIIIPYFFIQIFFNLILLILYLKKIRYKIFLTEFYYNIKMKVNIYKIGLITYNFYHILVVLFLGTFWKIIETMTKFYGKKLFIYILGAILSLIILPLHIIINPFLLFYAIKKYKKNKNKNEITLLKTYIYNI